MKKKREGRRPQFRGVKDLGNGHYLGRARRLDAGRRVERERRVVAKSLQEALEHRRQLEREISGEVPEQSARPTVGAFARPTVGAFARQWLVQRRTTLRRDGTPRLAPSTRRRYEHAVEVMVLAFLGSTPLAELTRPLVERWRDHLGAHFASATVNGALNVLRSILREADSAAATGVRPLELDDTRITDDEPNALDEEELGRFVAATRALYPQHVALVLVLLTTGQRIGTVLALRVEDLDRERRTITFRRRLSEGELLPGVKRSRKARDVAPLLDEVEAELDLKLATMSPAERESGLVFPAEDGRHHARTLLREPFKRILAQAGTCAPYIAPGACWQSRSDLGSSPKSVIARGLHDATGWFSWGARSLRGLSRLRPGDSTSGWWRR